VLLLVNEHTPLFGFMDYGYRAASIAALVAEGATALFLSGHLRARMRQR
jgi:hypothetical protein